MEIWFLLLCFIRGYVCAVTSVTDTWSDDFNIISVDPYETDEEGWWLHVDNLASGDYVRNTYYTSAWVNGAQIKYSGPYYIYGLSGTSYKDILLERDFECTGAFSISFKYCHCGMGPSNTFTVKYVNSDGVTKTLSSISGDPSGSVLATNYVDSRSGTVYSYGYEYNALSYKDQCGTPNYAHGRSWICTSSYTFDDFQFGWGNELRLQFDVSVDDAKDTFALKDLTATCDTSVEREIYTADSGCIDYDPFALIASDTSRSLVFGFKTYKPSDITLETADAKPHGTVVIDLYDSDGGLYRCHHLGIGFHTLYQCSPGVGENVVKLSSDSNPEGYTNKMVIHGFEFIRAYVQVALVTTIDIGSTENFVGSDGAIDASTIMFARLWETDDSGFNTSSSVMSFSLNVDSAESCMEMDARMDDDPLNLNGVDTQFGITIASVAIEIESIEETREELAESISLFVRAAQTARVQPTVYQENECIWDTGLDEAISGISGDVEEDEFQNFVDSGLSVINTVGAVAAIFPGGSTFGGALMAGVSVFGLFSDEGPSKEEQMVEALADSTTYAMETMKNSMDLMMGCSKEYTDYKFTEIKEEMNAHVTNLENSIDDLAGKVSQQMTKIEDEFGVLRGAINDANDRMDLQKQELQEEFDAKLAAQDYKQALELDIRMIDMEYKVHIENVEQDIANLLDTMDKLNRQWDHIKTLTVNSEIVSELSSMLQFTMPRFAGVVKRKPDSAEFDFFWRLYAQELTVFVMQIMTMRMDIWTLWIYFSMNGDNPVDSITEITPDYHPGFRDLNGELISEYIELLPYAMYAIIDAESDSTAIVQRTKLLDNYKEIEYRFQPKTACAWIEYTMYMTETDDLFFLGVSEIQDLYDADLNVCADNIRKYVIDAILHIDEAHTNLYTSTADSYEVPGFVVQSTDYGAESHWNSLTGWNYCYGNGFRTLTDNGDCLTGCCLAGYDNRDTTFATPGWTKSFKHTGSITGFTWSIAPTWYYRHNTYSDGEYSKPFNYHLLEFATMYVNEEIDSDSLVDEGDIDYDNERGALLSTTAKCSEGFAVSAIRFGYHYNTVNDYERWGEKTYADVLELNGFKLLCRPLSTVSDDLYRSFTLYEIASDSWFEEDADVYSEWYGCPIGTVIKSITYNFDYQYDASNGANHALNSGMVLECGNIDALNLQALIASSFGLFVKDFAFDFGKHVTYHPILVFVSQKTCTRKVYFL